MSTVKININKLTAQYSSTCHFKIKIVLSTSPYKESAENKHSFKYEKGSSEINIYEKLELKPFAPLSPESKLQFFLEVYTKTGYKTAGVGVLHLSQGVETNVPIKIEIQKCPLGKGYLEIQFLNFNINPSTSPKKINIPMRRQVSNDKTSNHSNNISYLNNQDKSFISNISYTTNMTNIEPPSNYHINKSPDPKYFHSRNNNKYYIKTSFGNNNDDIIKEKDRQINELKTKINYYEDENNELKNLIKDFKKEKKALIEEKNMQLNKEKEKLQKIINEKDDLNMQFISLQQNVNILKKNKSENEQKIINLRAQSDKQIRDLVQQVKNLNNIKIQLENDNKTQEEKLIVLDRKIKEMSVNYQKKFAELNNNYSEEKNNNFLNFNEKLKLKEQEIAKLSIKIQSLEENIQSLNDIIDLNDKQKEEKEELTENMTKLLSQISEKDQQIFELKGEITVLNDKITKERNDKKTQSMLNGITEKDLKNNINELKNIINEKDNELAELRTKYDNIKYNSKKLQPKTRFIEDSDEEIQNGNDDHMIDQIKEIQKTYKEREEKLLREKNEEIKKLRMRNNDLVRESYLDNNNIDMKKYINEIKRLKTINNNLEEDLGYYKELNNKFMDSEKRITVLETENIRFQNLLQKKEEEIDDMQKKYKKLEEENSMLEKQLVNSKGKLGDVLNELAEVETKCVHLEEEQRQMKKTVINGGK